MAQQTPAPEWLSQRDDLLRALRDEHVPLSERRLAGSLAGRDPQLVAYLLEQAAAQRSPEAAAFLELVATQADLSAEQREQARQSLAALAADGIFPAAPEAERFVAGYVQRRRERGEQILLLGWRLPAGGVEALVFLLNWRNDGLKDFYATRQLTDAEWRELVEHNAAKGALLVEVTLADARDLIEAALAESRRFSRPLPREYRLAPGVVERRVLRVEHPPGEPRSFVAPDLPPAEVVAAYAAALHFRDYALAAELLAPEHPLRAKRSVRETAEALRSDGKHAPRREEEVEIAPASVAYADQEERCMLDAVGTEVEVQASGKRTRIEVCERYLLARYSGGWRILKIERLAAR
jgi:hypothetical protein